MDCPWETYYELSLAEQAIATRQFGDGKYCMLYDFKAMKAVESSSYIEDVVDIVA